jgi:hypothetical protein
LKIGYYFYPGILFLCLLVAPVSAAMTEVEGYDVLADIQDNGNSANILPYNVVVENGQIYVGIINETTGDFQALVSPKARILSPSGNIIAEFNLQPIPGDNEYADMVNYWYSGVIDLSSNNESGQGALEIADGVLTIGRMDIWLTPGRDTFILRVSDAPEETQVEVETLVVRSALGLWSWRDRELPEIENILYGYKEFRLFPGDPLASEYIEVREIDTERGEVLLDIAGENVILKEDSAVVREINGMDFLVGVGGIEARAYSYHRGRLGGGEENITLGYAMLTLAPAEPLGFEELLGSPGEVSQLGFEEKRFRPMDHEELASPPAAQSAFTYLTSSGDRVWLLNAQPGKTYGPFDVDLRSHYITTSTGSDWMETTNFNSPQLRWRTLDKETWSYLHLGPFEFNGKRTRLGDFAYNERHVEGSIWGGPIGVLTQALHNGWWTGGGWTAQGGQIRIREM